MMDNGKTLSEWATYKDDGQKKTYVKSDTYLRILATLSENTPAYF
jgi:hypothetical protein|tara:strand:+ start:126 stop:260 length:135 start_codon:yes stop_codon:yes gene_type:complete